ncbi:HAMP domain-containing sensor histidine kinase [Ammoniphilus sp. CFH 90114]|uniref:sensor histidine kinase n=1 Tax=Ammoniphilus sp. CFH 90114 TaxID=2493665 RepID=UPI00100E0313|nr:HAMP domain-containing sensor histidine kinase [Ammoniphilus sp. CFH 90114]RXT00368.1 GHKL domain-containing protein [Ammoniphilus sp. CFH 90114]
MDIKWKNRWLVMVWLFLFSHGISGISMGLFHGDNYINKNYFESDKFENQLQEFIDGLILFELNDLSKEEAKKQITVTHEEIEEHRYRYGNLEEQIANIKAQYEIKIEEAQASKNQALADAYISERDAKIEDITHNFLNDEHVRSKVVKEKEQKIDEYYREIEYQRADFTQAKGVFLYHLTNTETGKVYTNTHDQAIHTKDMRYIRTYPSTKYGSLSTNLGSTDLDSIIGERHAAVFEGQIAVPKSALIRSVLPSYYEFESEQTAFYIYLYSGLISLIGSLVLWKKATVFSAISLVKGQSIYKRIPLDIGTGLFAGTGFITLIMLVDIRPHRFYGSFYEGMTDLLSYLLIIVFFIGLTLLQGKYLLARHKDALHLKADWKKSVSYRTISMIKNAFLIRQIGTQIFLLLMIAFAFGGGLIIGLMEPELLILYAIGFLLVGLPTLIWLFRSAGYLNEIIVHTNHLVSGKDEPDLPVKGKSALATLARNINQLKLGVKSSKKEQAKSERLKTELITNVSHDLRTPLTSVITYTELLKNPGLAEVDRNSYIEIIDRKSKRLKVLIDDLFEATKMASGNVNLVKEKVDIVQLLQQALAEYNEQIKESTLQFRVSTPDPPIFVQGDGQKLWRVLENLIGNILKYSLENTRVYITVKMDANQAVLTFKNVTKYELGENIEDLFERFKRGDTSRQTEGSGLGLAIAKSIIDLHDGNLDLDIDGDLFKVTVTLETK